MRSTYYIRYFSYSNHQEFNLCVPDFINEDEQYHAFIHLVQLLDRFNIDPKLFNME